MARSTGSGTDGGDHQASVDLRNRLPAVRDQGERSTCLAFAVTAAHEFARRGSPDTDDLSEDALYWGCKQVDGNWEPGSSFESARQALDQWGQPVEETWAYDEDRTDSGPYGPPDGVTPGDAAWFRGRLSQMALDLDGINDALRDGAPVAIGIVLTDGFYRPDDEGRIPGPKDQERLWEGHAVLVVGFLEDDGGYLIVRNSWGPDWGLDGYGLLPTEYFLRFGLAVWSAEVVV
jgi:C1A family cysteine protease